MKIPDLRIGAVLQNIAERYPNHDALVAVNRSKKYSYKALLGACRQIAKGLLKIGIKKGDKTALWSSNTFEWVMVQFAAASIGSVLVPINANEKLPALESILNHSDASTLIMIESFRKNNHIDMVNELCPELPDCAFGELDARRLPGLKRLIVIGDQTYPGVTSLDDIVKMGESVSDEALAARQDELDANDVIHMIYTSGSTGVPKGVMLTHANLVQNAMDMAERLKLTPEDRMCIQVPFSHCFGCVAGNLCCAVSGAAMLPIEYFKPEVVLETVEKERCTVLHGVPTMFIMLLENLEQNRRDIGSLRTGLVAGASCPDEVMAHIIEKLHITEAIAAYGQTEASPCITCSRPEDPLEKKLLTAGRVLPNVEVKIIHPETGETLPPGKEGEICARGYNIMAGYYKMPEKTAATVDREQWLHTGDLGSLDEAGYLSVYCRLKEIIIRSGENISPREIEACLLHHPAIQDAQVIGVPSFKYGEEVMAYIKLNPGEATTAEDIRAYCEGKIAKFKIPKYVSFIENYPVSENGKVLKAKLKEKAIAALGLVEQ
jgi:fatty-acyl-CoA synthase